MLARERSDSEGGKAGPEEVAERLSQALNEPRRKCANEIVSDERDSNEGRADEGARPNKEE